MRSRAVSLPDLALLVQLVGTTAQADGFTPAPQFGDLVFHAHVMGLLHQAAGETVTRCERPPSFTS
jgi:hypothetical protein